MRRLLAGMAMAAALAFASIGAHAEAPFSAEDGNQPYADCSEPASVKGGVCAGYVLSIYDAMATGASIAGYVACIESPADVSKGEVVNFATQFLAAHPEKRNSAAVLLIAETLHEAFPLQPVICQPSSRKT